MWNRSRPTRGSSWSAWRSRTWTRSTASRRRWRSGRKTPRAIRARRSPHRPSCTIFCACCGRAPGAPIAPTAAVYVERERWIRWRRRCWRSPKDRAGTRCFPIAAGEDHRGVARPPVRSAQEGLQSPVSGQARVRVFDARIAAGHRFLEAGVRAGGPPGDLARHAAAAGRYRRDLLSRSRRSHLRTGATGGETLRFNEKFPCKKCGKEFVEPEPSLFSFNSPYGACKRCQGFGNTIDYDMDLVIPDRSLSIAGGRGGSLDQAAAFLVHGGVSQGRASGKVRIERAVLRIARGGTRAGLRAHPALLQGGGNQEIQSPRARVPEPLSRLHHCARIAAARACGPRLCTFAWAERPWPKLVR